VLFMTVPTAGKRHELLANLIRDSGLSPENIVLVATRPDLDLPGGTVIVEDLGPINIQRWWLRGIEECAARGATAVAVCNDDLELGPATLEQLHAALVQTGAAIASPSRPPRRDGLHKGHLIPYSPRIWGCLWMVDVASGLRPDPRYVWWYGDNDLDIRARRDYSGIVTVPVEFSHRHPGEGTGASEFLTEQTRRDTMTFQGDYARIMTLTGWINRLRRMIGLKPVPM
jgi:hypothetical protein